MESPLKLWRARSGEVWVEGFSAGGLEAEVERRRKTLAAGGRPLVFSLREPEPRGMLVDFLAAITLEEPVQIFLGDAPGAISGTATQTRIMIATGGSSGAPRFAVHSWETLSAAAAGLQRWLGGGPIHSACCLPLRHVSGLMQVIRSFTSGGRLSLFDLNGGGGFPPPPPGGVISLVPTQLARLLRMSGGADWLRRFSAVFLGGAPAWPSLLAAARAERIPLAPCYGSTETAAQVAALPPAEFLAGGGGVGRALPHAALEVVDEAGAAPVPAGAPGRIRVRASSLFFGYWPADGARPEALVMDDRGMLDAAGALSVLGRTDALINSGGEKVDPGAVEAAIRSAGGVDDVAVVGVADGRWGEAVVAVVAGGRGHEAALREHLRGLLAPHEVPKRYVWVEALPRNAAGKLNRTVVRAIAAEANPPS